MAGTGRISVLVSSELQAVSQAIRGLDREVAAQLRKHTKAIVEPVWQEAVRGRVDNRLQTRVLSDTARAGVSDQNVMLRSASAGRVSSGAPASMLSTAVEFGASPDKIITTRSRNGKVYKRRMGRVFNLPRRNGYVVFPAAREVIPRIASLWVSTVIRTVHEKFEEGGAK